MSKIKMRCITCGKWFQSANAKDVTCPDCAQKARKEKLAQKNAPATRPAGSSAAPPRPAVPPRPKAPTGNSSSWLDKIDDVKVSQPEQHRPKSSPPPGQRGPMGGSPGYRERGSANSAFRDERERTPPRGPAAYHMTEGSTLSPTLGQRPRQPYDPNRRPNSYRQGPPGATPGPRGNVKPNRPPRPKATRPAAPPKPKREKTPPPQPFEATPEQIKQVEERYAILAQPAEFDGIRTQIAQELSIPKKAVKKIIKNFRTRTNIPSWWEVQTYKGSVEELDRIKNAYLPFLPVPTVGVHKFIAEQLTLKPGTVYQAIKTIRQDLHLPQYNDPALHAEELARLSRERKPAGSSSTSSVEAPVVSSNNTDQSEPHAE